MNETEQTYPQHERRDVDVVSIFTVVVILFILFIVIFLGVTGLIHYLGLREPAKTAGQANIPATHSENYPAPRLEIEPGASLAELRRAEDADLNSYGWINRAAGTVRIPIDRAMQLIVERGLPNVGAGQTPLSLMQARPVETSTPPRLMQKR